MANTSKRSVFQSAGLAAFVAAALMTSGSVAEASGLPLRAPCLVSDPGMAGLSEGIWFKLQRLKGNQQTQSSTWESMVDDALLVALRLGFPADMPVSALRVNNTYVVEMKGEGHIAGADPDQVLGRLLYTLAHSEGVRSADSSAVALSILDQPLSVTVSALASNAP